MRFSLLAGSSMGFSLVSRTMACIRRYCASAAEHSDSNMAELMGFDAGK
jgi:hypothetical protein